MSALVASPSIARQVASMFSRMHVLVVGPGLGRKPEVLEATKQIIRRARAENMPMVIDADGLFVISQDPDIIRDARNVVRTETQHFYWTHLHWSLVENSLFDSDHHSKSSRTKANCRCSPTGSATR